MKGMNCLVFFVWYLTVTLIRGEDYYGVCVIGLGENDACTASYTNGQHVDIKDGSTSHLTIKTGSPLNLSSGHCFDGVRLQPFQFSNDLALNVSITFPGDKSTHYYLNSIDPRSGRYTYINCTSYPCDVIIVSLQNTDVKLNRLQSVPLTPTYLVTNAVYNDASIMFSDTLLTAFLRINHFLKIKGRHIAVFTSESGPHFGRKIQQIRAVREQHTELGTVKCECQQHCYSTTTSAASTNTTHTSMITQPATTTSSTTTPAKTTSSTTTPATTTSSTTTPATTTSSTTTPATTTSSTTTPATTTSSTTTPAKTTSSTTMAATTTSSTTTATTTTPATTTASTTTPYTTTIISFTTTPATATTPATTTASTTPPATTMVSTTPPATTIRPATSKTTTATTFTISSPTTNSAKNTDFSTPTTTTKQNTNTTRGVYTGPNVSCLYSCTFTIDSHLSEAERSRVLLQKIAAIKQQLAVNKTRLSSTIRSKTSAMDNRPVAAVIGFMGVAVLGVFGALIILFDLPLIVRRFTQTCVNIKSEFSSYQIV